MYWVAIVLMLQQIKRNQQVATKDKESDESPKLTLLKWKGNVIVAENEVINLLNVIIITDLRKNGL